MSHRDDIIRFIERNRVSTTEVADALGKTGVIPGVVPITPDIHRVGPVHAVFVAHNSNYNLHVQAREVEAGDVVVVFAHDCDGRAIMGDLITKFLLLYQGASAIVVEGLVRDASRLRRERYAMWAKGVSPLGCHNRPADDYPAAKAAEVRARVDGGVAVCDDGGVTVIPPDRLDADMLERLQRIELQEDVWSYCLDTLKWDTKTIVCDKSYLDRPDELPEAYRKQLGRLSQPLDAPARKT